LSGRLLEDKREACEINFADFDEVSFRISSSAERPNVVKVNMAMRNVPYLKENGSQAVLDRLFPGLETAPDAGFQVALEFDCDRIAGEKAVFLEKISELKRHVFGGPLDKAFTALSAGRSEGLPVVKIDYRKNEVMFVCPAATKVLVVFLVDFEDATDKALAKVFLQEFVEAQRAVRSAPPVSYTKDPPGELASVDFRFNSDIAGFLGFSLEPRHVADAHKESAITLLTGFRNYLHYHIKASKTYLHMRMRKRVAGWLQVLNRAVPESTEGGEKKLASGKTFVRK